MRSIVFVVLVACGNPGQREVGPLAPQPNMVPGANDKEIFAPSPALAPPDAAAASSTGGSINISVEADSGVPTDATELPPLLDAVMPDAGTPMHH